MPKWIDLTGKRFGRLLVIAYAQRERWSCICDCDARVVVHGGSLRSGRTKGCGCLRSLRRIDLTGKRFGRWTVRAYAGDRKWSCLCDCGARVIVDGNELRRGSSKSCGCRRRELAKARATKHGMSGTPEYNSWSAMMARCFNPRHPHYENYGGQGISVYEDWRSILGWFADMGTRPPGCSLDRIDPNGNYEPGNCRWADRKQQRQNRRPRRATVAVKRCQVEPPPLDDPPF
jgi:hypothetical protein